MPNGFGLEMAPLGCKFGPGIRLANTPWLVTGICNCAGIGLTEFGMGPESCRFLTLLADVLVA